MKKTLLLLSSVIFSLIGFSQTVPSYIPLNGLVGWWPFNGNANDESGNGNNGNVNGPILTSDRFGNQNSAYYFSHNGASLGNNHQSIYVPYNNQFATSEYTISVWVRAENYGWAGNSIISSTVISKRENSASVGQASYRIQFDETIWSGLTNGGCGISSNVFNLNTWVLLTMTYDGQYEKYFLNDFEVYSVFCPSITSNTTSTSGIMMGQTWQSNGYWYHLQGDLDDIGIWNRALTQEEITNLYNSCQLSINTQPINQTININNNSQFVVGSSNQNSTFQWQTDLGVGFQNITNAGQYSGALSNTLTISNVTMNNDNQSFRCIVSSGSCSDTSDVAVLTVNNNVGIIENSISELFTLYPNPTNGVININAENKLIGKNYSIYDNLGREVSSGLIKSENSTIELNDLKEGFYIIRIGENLEKTVIVVEK